VRTDAHYEAHVYKAYGFDAAFLVITATASFPLTSAATR